MKKRGLTDILIWIVGTEIVGALSALLSGGFSQFFDTHKEPPLLPPAWLFPVIWVILYTIMGFSAYLVYPSNANKALKRSALNVYFVQLALNFLWSIIFFRFETLWFAFAEILLLWITIIVMIIKFRKISQLSAYLNIPYLIWVTFATYLNLATAIIN